MQDSFRFNDIPPEAKVKPVSVYFNGKASQWNKFCVIVYENQYWIFILGRVYQLIQYSDLESKYLRIPTRTFKTSKRSKCTPLICKSFLKMVGLESTKWTEEHPGESTINAMCVFWNPRFT